MIIYVKKIKYNRYVVHPFGRENLNKDLASHGLEKINIEI